MKTRAALMIVACTLISPAGAQAQLAVSANDGKQPLLYEQVKDPKPDMVAVIDLNHYPPKVVGTVNVPTSMLGPPTSIAMAHDSSFAIATRAMKFDPADPSKFVPDDTISVIGLKDPAHPVVLQTLQAGAGVTGISINKADTLALAANLNDGTVSIFSITGKTLAPAGKVQLDPVPGPIDVAISPDGKTALVSQRYGKALWRLAIDHTKVTNTGVTIATGGSPYGIVFSRDGRFAYNANLLGRSLPGDPIGQRAPGQARPAIPAAQRTPRPPRIGTITVVDLKTNTVVNTIEVGPTPENVALSPDGKYLQVTVVNGSSANPKSANYHDFGLMKIFHVEGGKLTEVAEAKTGQWGQGATWNKTGRVILLQSGIDKNIEVYRFDGKTLTRDMNATLKFDGRPGAIMTALSR